MGDSGTQEASAVAGIFSRVAIDSGLGGPTPPKGTDVAGPAGSPPERTPPEDSLPAGFATDPAELLLQRKLADGPRSAADAARLLPALIQHRKKAGGYYPSPVAWEDLTLYFLMVDRFSDGKEKDFVGNDGQLVAEGTTPKYAPDAPPVNEADVEKGRRFLGGTLQGATTKLGYLARLGVKAVWLSPIFKQSCWDEFAYHGYAIQNFLDIDPRFAPGCKNPEERRQVLRRFVDEAHRLGIRVVLDIVLNHAGDVFEYDADRHPVRDERGVEVKDPRWDGYPYQRKGFRGTRRDEILTDDQLRDAWPDGAVWPSELQEPDAFTYLGHISNWDYFPEYIDGDFLSLKNIRMGWGDTGNFIPSRALRALATSYKFWMAHADIDGFRLDTVKHIELGATRFFASEIREFAQLLEKNNFYLIGEITGGRQRAFETLELTGLDAALGIDDIPYAFERLMLGEHEPVHYFSLFRNSNELNKDSQTWFNSRVVTMFNDHDMVGRPPKRLCHYYPTADSRKRIALLALALNVTTMGIPCIYYGSEQCFDGGGDSDVWLRQSMFGGGFGAFGTGDRHFFDENRRVYLKLQELLRLREQHLTLRRGRQYLRGISGDKINFGLPTGWGGPVRTIIAWSRIFANHEVLIAMNTDLSNELGVWVTVDTHINSEGSYFQCEYDIKWECLCLSDDKKERLPVEPLSNGRSTVFVKLPPGGFKIFCGECGRQNVIA